MISNSIYREIIERTILRAHRVGKVVLTINPKYTSMDCNNCSQRNLFLKLRDKIYQCSSCNNVEHRDVNASKNIEYKGVKELLKELERVNTNETEKIALNTDGQVSMVVE